MARGALGVTTTRPVTAEAAASYDLPDLAGGLRVPDARPSAEQLVGPLLLLRPLRLEEVQTEYGSSLATVTYVVEVIEHDQAGACPYIDRGQVPLLWQHVRAELAKCSAERPWTAGVVVKRTRAYFLNGPTPEQGRAAERALGAFIEDRSHQADQGDAHPEDDGPVPVYQDHGADCEYCEGEPYSQRHPYQPPAGKGRGR